MLRSIVQVFFSVLLLMFDIWRVHSLPPPLSLVSLPGDVAALIQAECFARGIEVLSVSVAADEVRAQCSVLDCSKPTAHLIYNKGEGDGEVTAPSRHSSP